jgi:DNA mismatch repair protein MutS
MEQNIVAVPYEEEEWPNEDFYSFLMRAIKYQAHMHEFKKRRTSFLMLDRIAQNHELKENNVLSDITTWKDLNLFAGQKDITQYLADKIDRTHTCFGKAQLYTMLSQPSTDFELLKQRQEIIKLMLDNPNLYNQLNDALQKLKETENLFLSFWCNDQIYQAAKRRYYAFATQKITDSFNRNARLLELRNTLDHTQRLLWAGSGALAALLLPLFGISYLTHYSLSPGTKKIAQHLQSSNNPLGGILTTMSDNKCLHAGMNIAVGGYAGLCVKEAVGWVRDNFVLDACMQTRLCYAAAYINAMQNLKNIIDSHPALKSSLQSSNLLCSAFEHAQTNRDVKKLLEALSADCFKGKLCLFSDKGIIYLAFKLMHENKEYFEDALSAVGELDAYMSLAQLYKEHEGKQAQFSFAKFKKDGSPSIQLKEFWNPFINPEKVITNSVMLGGDSMRRDMIITGPNAGGKSTLLKAIAITVIMAQSFGIAPAQEVIITPFDKIISYLNITDDIGSGNSLFKAQVLRAQQLLDTVGQLKDKQFGFFIIDEMFNGTSPKEAEAAAFSVAKNIGQFQNAICIIATHFPLITTLETQTQNFANYNVSVEQTRGNIKYPFKLLPGISHQHIAIDILRAEGFNGQIIDDAKAILNNV